MLPTVSDARITLALREANNAIGAYDDPNVTRDMLLCSLDRIATLLGNETYYDYDSQQYVRD